MLLTPLEPSWELKVSPLTTYLRRYCAEPLPLSAEDKFAAFTGPLTGVTGAPALVRTVVVIKSPLTGGWTDWYFGGS